VVRGCSVALLVVTPQLLHTIPRWAWHRYSGGAKPITVGAVVIAAHLAYGDSVGPCQVCGPNAECCLDTSTECCGAFAAISMPGRIAATILRAGSTPAAQRGHHVSTEARTHVVRLEPFRAVTPPANAMRANASKTAGASPVATAAADHCHLCQRQRLQRSRFLFLRPETHQSAPGRLVRRAGQ
jgi:hypothetical protein